MTQLRKLNDVCLFVKDLEETERFYAEKLGFMVKRRQPGYIELDFDGTSVTLWEERGVLAAIEKKHLGGDGHHFMLAVRVSRLEDVDEIAARLKACGVLIISEARTYPWGAKALYFKDNEGNIWEVFAWQQGNGPGLTG